MMPERGFDPGPDEEDQTYPQGPDWSVFVVLTLVCTSAFAVGTASVLAAFQSLKTAFPRRFDMPRWPRSPSVRCLSLAS